MTRFQSDEGFSLSEMVVVVGLLGIILAIAWMSYSVASNGSRAADRESMTARELAVPLLQCERLLIQQHNILTGNLGGRTVNPGAYIIAFNTDQDHDSHIESTIIEATSAGELIISTSEVGEHAMESVIWSSENHNVETGTPLLTYFRDDGTEITNASEIASDARAVEISIVTEYQDRPYTDSRFVTFRNR